MADFVSQDRSTNNGASPSERSDEQLNPQVASTNGNRSGTTETNAVITPAVTTNNNNRRNDTTNRGTNQGRNNDLASIRERLFQALFFRVAVAYARTFPPSFRRFIEFSVLLKALTSLSLLMYINVAFNSTPLTCLDHIKDDWPRDGVLRVEIIKNASAHYSLNDSYEKEEQLIQKHMDLLDVFSSEFDMIFGRADQTIDPSSATVAPVNDASVSETQVESEGNKTQEILESEEDIQNVLPQSGLEEEEQPLEGTETSPSENTEGSNEQEESFKEFQQEEEEDVKRADPSSTSFGDYMVEFSLEAGLLRLSAAARRRLGVPVMLVVLDPLKELATGGCFGSSSISHFVMEELLGYDDVLMGAVKSLKSLHQAEEDATTEGGAKRSSSNGFVRNVVTGEHFRFQRATAPSGPSAAAATSYAGAAFVMVMFTLSVSMLLRYSHHQIFLFIVDLLQMLELNVAVSFPAAPMLTVILALVGMEAIMSEFFNDTSMAFYLIVLVWLCDQYEAICCHTAITRKHWLRFFYLYHFAFYAYHYRFNGQYSWLALVTSWLFIFHSMLYFFHHYELPALLLLQGASPLARLRTLNVVVRPHQPTNNNPTPQATSQEVQTQQGRTISLRFLFRSFTTHLHPVNQNATNPNPPPPAPPAPTSTDGAT